LSLYICSFPIVILYSLLAKLTTIYAADTPVFQPNGVDMQVK